MFDLTDEELSNLSDEELDEINAKTIFVRDAMPGEWLDYADELMDAAEILWEKKDHGRRLYVEGFGENTDLEKTKEPKIISSISRTYILLAGFSLENLIKGLLVAQNPSHITSGKLSGDLKSHRILNLVRKVKNFPLSKEEKNVCKIIQDALPYWGRYPIPLEFNGVLPEIAINADLRKVILELHERLSFRIYQLIRDGWESGVGPGISEFRSSKYGDFEFNTPSENTEDDA